MSWDAYVEATKNLGFKKVTIIARANYATLAKSSDQDIATAYMDGDKQINENQELLDDWSDVKKRAFHFYVTKFNIILRETDGDVHKIVCAKGNEICIAAQFKTIWFVVYGKKVKMNMDKENNDKKQKPEGFRGAQGAYNEILKGVWDNLEEAGV